MTEYLRKRKTIVDNLLVVVEEITDRDRAFQALAGLGSEYNPIVASLTISGDDLSIHAVRGLLLTQE